MLPSSTKHILLSALISGQVDFVVDPPPWMRPGAGFKDLPVAPFAAASQRFELQRPDQAGVKQANAVLGFEIGLRRHGVFPCRSVRGAILVRAVAFPELVLRGLSN